MHITNNIKLHLAGSTAVVWDGPVPQVRPPWRQRMKASGSDGLSRGRREDGGIGTWGLGICTVQVMSALICAQTSCNCHPIYGQVLFRLGTRQPHFSM